MTDTYTDKQRTIVEEFRERLADVLTQDKDFVEDYDLSRFLIARSWNIKKAEKMYRNTMEWRKQNGIDDILETYTMPEVLEKYYPGGWYSYDREGRPLYCESWDFMDLKGIHYSVKKSDIMRFRIWMLEKGLRLCRQQTQQLNRRIAKMGYIIDLKAFSSDHLWKPAMDCNTELTQLMSDHYPETMAYTIILHAPMTFYLAWNAIGVFADEKTQKKIQMIRGRFKEEGELGKLLASDQVPAQMGGTLTDENGDPRCSAIIPQGGTVPQTYYQTDYNQLGDSWTEVEVDSGSSVKLPRVIHNAGYIISWQFMSKPFEIGFAIYKRRTDNHEKDKGKLKTKDMDEVVAHQIYHSHLFPEDGTLEIETPGDYVIRFDNKHSKIRSCNVKYNLSVLRPPDPSQLEDNNNEDDIKASDG